MSDKLKEPASSRDSTMEAKNTVEVPLTSSEGKEEAATPKLPSRFDWDVLRSLRGRLKLAQVLVGILVLGLGYPRSHLGVGGHILFFVVLHVTLITLVALVDALLKNHPVEKVFGKKLWNRLELRYTGWVALVLHCLAYWNLISTFYPWGREYQKIVCSVFAFATDALYFVDWWRLFYGRPAAAAESGTAVDQVVVETS